MKPKDIAAPLISIYSKTDLLKGFVVRDIKGSFAGSMGGFLWTIISPLATIIAYFFVFSVVMRVSVSVEETGTDRFALFFLSGFFPWIMFADCLAKSVGVLLNEAALITKVMFPVELLPISTVISTFIVNCVGFLLLLIYLAFTGFFHWAWLLIPPLLLIEALFVLGIAFFISSLCVFIRDTREILTILLMLWFFGTPIIYPSSMVPEGFRIVLGLNPLTLFVNTFREIILMNRIDVASFFQLLCISLISYAFGAWFFTKSKPAFGDVL